MIIPLKTDKSVDVAIEGISNSGTIYWIKIIAIGYLKDCTWNCWTCETTSAVNCTSCRNNFYLYTVTATCVTNCSTASSNGLINFQILI